MRRSRKYHKDTWLPAKRAPQVLESGCSCRLWPNVPTPSNRTKPTHHHILGQSGSWWFLPTQTAAKNEAYKLAPNPIDDSLGNALVINLIIDQRSVGPIMKNEF